jgi:hypothetical protein
LREENLRYFELREIRQLVYSRSIFTRVRVRIPTGTLILVTGFGHEVQVQGNIKKNNNSSSTAGAAAQQQQKIKAGGAAEVPFFFILSRPFRENSPGTQQRKVFMLLT